MKRERYIYIILFNISICFIMNSQFLNLHYSMDAFNILNSSSQDALNHIQNGRFLSTILIEIFNFLNINLITSAVVWTCVFLLGNALISYYFADFLSNLFSLNSKSSTHLLLIDCGMLLLVNNIFSAELLTFSECIPLYTVAHICAVYSVVLITTSSKIKKGLGLFLLMVSFNTYQVFITEYVYLIMISIFVKNRGRINKDSFKQILESAAYAFITVFSNILIARIFMYQGWIAQNSRYNFSLTHSLTENFLKFLKEQITIWGSGQGLMPHGFMLLFLVFLIIVLSRKLYYIKVPIDTIIFIILTLISGLMCIGAMAVIQGDLIWLPPRTLVPLFGIFTILIFMIVYFYQDSIMPEWIIAPAFLFVFINIFYVQSYASNLKASNEMDYQWVKNIEYEINRHEAKTGKEITKIGFIQDENVSVRWDNSIRYRYDVVIRAPFVDWEQINIINYYTGKKFEKVNSIPTNIENYFKTHDWNTYCPDEQLIFKDDTLFMGIY